MEIELLESEHIADDIHCFRFKKPPAIDFDAGDYVELAVRHNDGGSHRWMTISSSPHEEVLEFITKIHPSGSDFKRALKNLPVGHKATISPPIGSFNLPRTPQQNLLWVAGGIGITPYISMARWLRTHKSTHSITSFYVAKPESFHFLDEIKPVSSALHTTSERISTQDILEHTKSDRDIIYLSGPAPFCLSLYDELQAHGVKRQNLKLDYFPGYVQV